MDFTLNDEQRMLVDAATRYVRDHCNLEQRRQASCSEDGFSRDHWRNFADLGWLALNLPERVGGLAWGVTELALLMEQLAQGLVVEPVIDTSVLCGSLLASASSTHADHLLERIARGDLLAALAQVEGGGRSEFDSPLTTTATEEGSGWRLDGVKHLVFGGHNADLLVVGARLGNGELGLFAVAADSAGLSRDNYRLIDGSRAADIRLDGVTVSGEALLLRGQAAREALELAIDKSIVAGCGSALGTMETVMAMTADYLKTRVQYGKPLAQFQALQHRMAEMLVETEQARAMLCRALSHFDDPAERPCAVSAAKVLISRAARWVTAQGIQLHGGIATTEEYAVGHHYKAMLAFEQRFGTSDWHLARCDALIDRSCH